MRPRTGGGQAIQDALVEVWQRVAGRWRGKVLGGRTGWLGDGLGEGSGRAIEDPETLGLFTS